MPDSITFELVPKLSCIGVGRDGDVHLLFGNDLYDITDTNLGRWLLDAQDWGKTQHQSTDQFRGLETSGTIQ
jgi:hypothetical protein